MLLGAWPTSSGAAAHKPTELAGHCTVEAAKVSSRPSPIPVRYVYGRDRDWIRQPYRLGVVLIEMRDTPHAAAHTAAVIEGVLRSRTEVNERDNGTRKEDWRRLASP